MIMLMMTEDAGPVWYSAQPDSKLRGEGVSFLDSCDIVISESVCRLSPLCSEGQTEADHVQSISAETPTRFR